MTDGADLVAKILAEPDCDIARLVYADWLQEHGDEARAEFVRVQIELAAGFAGPCRGCGRPLVCDRAADGCPCNTPRGVNHGLVPAYVCTCPECDPEQSGSARARPTEVERLVRRAVDLLDGPAPKPNTIQLSHWVLWFMGDLGFSVAFRPEFRRGFAESLVCKAADWLAFGDEILERHPVRSVKLTTRANWMLRGGRVWLHDGNFDAPAAAKRVCRNVGVHDRVGSVERGVTYLRGLFLAEWPGVAFEAPPDPPVTYEDFQALTDEILAQCASSWSIPAALLHGPAGG